MKNEDLEKTFAFILELEKLKAVNRRTKPLGQDRYENSAEHSWQAAVLAMALAPHADAGIDTERVLKMLLLHDICEIDADDVFFFDEAGRAAVKEKELKAMKRIVGLLPEKTADEFLSIWLEFEESETPEAKFAKAIDRLMPVLQNLYNNKQSWNEHGVTKYQVLEKTAYISEAGKEVWELIAAKIEIAFSREF